MLQSDAVKGICIRTTHSYMSPQLRQPLLATFLIQRAVGVIKEANRVQCMAKRIKTNTIIILYLILAVGVQEILETLDLHCNLQLTQLERRCTCC